ncbi:MAG: PilZ domain-containing protein [Candidatus Omnitrophota bacterium]
MKERRVSPRANKILPIKLSDSEFDILTETKNISDSGAYCSVNKPLEHMTKLNAVILIPIQKNKKKVIKKINCGGVVVRLEHTNDSDECPYRVAIFFNDIKDSDRKMLSACINTQPTS